MTRKTPKKTKTQGENLAGKTVLLVIAGGIAAYKALELIRLLKKDQARVRCILTNGGAQFITPLSVASISGETAYTDLWSLKDETEMGHICLSREADIIVVAPASADLLAKMAHGFADDLASTTLLAADKPVLIAPAMNHEMWNNAATQDNIVKLKERGIFQAGPEEGDMACGEYGMGRMAEPEDILAAIRSFFFELPLRGFRALVTSGPTHEPLDPVRYLSNRSSGKQGHAIAAALADAGADVTLVTGPVALPDPPRVKIVHVETAQEMLRACEKTLPADIAICAAAVSDWAPENTQSRKIKKRGDNSAPAIKLRENPDILKTLAGHKKRPRLVIGFAAETDDLLRNAKEKLLRKKCDWIMANDVSGGKIFGADESHIYKVTRTGAQDWKRAGKRDIARRLARDIIDHFSQEQSRHAAE